MFKLILKLQITCIYVVLTMLPVSAATTKLSYITTGWEYSKDYYPQDVDAHNAFSNSWCAIEYPYLQITNKITSHAWFRVMLPPGDNQCVYVSNVDQKFDVYWNFQKIYSYGSSEDLLAPFDWRIISIPNHVNASYLLFRIYSKLPSIGIVQGSILVGNNYDILYALIQQDIGVLIIGVLLACVGVLASLVFILRSNLHVFLSFGALSLCLGVYTYAQGALKQIIFCHSGTIWGMIELLSLLWIPVGLNHYVTAILGINKKSKLSYAWKISLANAIITTLLSFIVPNILMRILPIFQVILFINIICIIILIGYYTFLQRKHTLLLGGSVCILACFAIVDLLHTTNVLQGSSFITDWGLLIFISINCYVLMHKIIEMYNYLHAYTKELKCKNIAIKKANSQLNELYSEIEITQKEVILQLSEIAEARSKETGQHVRRVAEYACILAEEIGCTDKEIRLLRLASPMHDIGKLAIPDHILNKPDILTVEEFELIKTHTSCGFDMLHKSSRTIFKAAALIAFEHHEKYNGTGYPTGLMGENIHLFGRIIAVADVFDSLASDRCYKKAWDLVPILDLMQNEKSQHFDPIIVDALFARLDSFKFVRDTFQD